MGLKEYDKQKNRSKKLWLCLKKGRRLTKDSRPISQRQIMKSKRLIVMVNTMRNYIR